jgi:hypothetical protein
MLPAHWTVWLFIAISTLVTGSYFIYEAWNLTIILGSSNVLLTLIPVTLGLLFLALSLIGFRNMIRSRKKPL